MRIKFLFSVLIACAGLSQGARVVCPVTADTWVPMPPIERPESLKVEGTQNHGADPQLPVRGRESFALLQFDVSELKGKSVTKATLRVHRENTDPVPLHTVGLSTISGSGPWTEGTQKSGTAKNDEVNFLYARAGEQPWSYPGSDLIDVTFSQGGSLYTYVRPRDAGEGWYEIDVPAALVGALVSGDQYGLMLCDEKGQTQVRHVLSSRESSFPPELIVETGAEDKTAPGTVKSLKSGAPILASTSAEARALGRTVLRPGSVILKFGGAGDDAGKGIAAHYEVRYSEQPVTRANFESATPAPRWALNPLAPKPAPLATSNSLRDQVSAVVEQLKPGGVYYFAARAVDKAGNAGPVSALGRYKAYNRTFSSLPEPAAETVKPVPPSAGDDKLKVWAVPDLVKINPRTGALLERDYPDHRAQNSVWSSATNLVRLSGARNEFVAFQLAIESAQAVSGVEVKVVKPLFAANKLPAIFQKTGAIQMSREWFVPDGPNHREWYADALVPVSAPLDLPAKDNGVPDQTVQPVFVDVYIPHDAVPGKHTGRLAVKAAGMERQIGIQIDVLPITLPDNLNFVVDLNCYSGVPAPANARPGTPEYRSALQGWHRVAHLNRANLDVLGYSQMGPVMPDQGPPLEGEGANTKVTSWQDWDAHFGPLLSGSAFADLPRASVPVPAIYLPFFENWPGDLRKSYRFQHPEVIRTDEEYKDLVTRQALEAGPIEEAFTKEYQDRYPAVAAQFAQHIQQRGWLKTKYYYYFNNKYYFKRAQQGGRGSSLWLLDEPNHRDDTRALSFYADLVKKGLAKYPNVPIELRTDISRIEWIRDLMAGQIDMNCTSSRIYEKNRYLMDDRNRFGREFWNYASTNHPKETNVSMRTWCWRAWTAGANGIVPWNAVRGMSSWNRAEPLTVFYPGEKFGQKEPFPSLRLKAYRRGEQDVEYLVLLSKKQGWDREAVTRAVAKALDFSGGIEQSYDEDAGTVSFKNVRNEQLERLRARVAAALVGK
jgi:hypothetical protein